MYLTEAAFKQVHSAYSRLRPPQQEAGYLPQHTPSNQNHTHLAATAVSATISRPQYSESQLSSEKEEWNKNWMLHPPYNYLQ